PFVLLFIFSGYASSWEIARVCPVQAERCENNERNCQYEHHCRRSREPMPDTFVGDQPCAHGKQSSRRDSDYTASQSDHGPGNLKPAPQGTTLIRRFHTCLTVPFSCC